jgi:hypothetical protein
MQSNQDLEAVLLQLQHLACAIKSWLTAAGDSNVEGKKQCSMLLKLALNGALRAKAATEVRLLAGGGGDDDDDGSDDDDGEDLRETLAVLRRRYRAYDPTYDASSSALSTAERRRDALALDLEILWRRHCTVSRARGSDPGRLRRYLAHSEEISGSDSGSAQGLLADWAPPQGHASFSWRASKRRRPSSHSSFSWPLSTLSCCSAFSVRQPDAGLLLRIVAHVRSVEATASFRRSLLEGQRGMASQLGVDRETFTYGSTPFASWLRIFEEGCQAGERHGGQTDGGELLRIAVQRCRYQMAAAGKGDVRRQRRYVVFGSAMGLLPFYGAVGLGLCTVGFEIMPCLARRATAIARRFHLVEDDSLLRSSATEHPPHLHLVEGDMLKANLNDAGVVLLTSQCWDRQLIRRVHDKLAQELPDDALVVGTFYSRSLLAFI